MPGSTTTAAAAAAAATTQKKHRHTRRHGSRRHHHHPQLAELPRPVMERIATFLRPADVCALARVSKGWNEACSSDVVWRALYASEFHIATVLPEHLAQPSATRREAFPRQRTLLRRLDECRRAARPREGWTEHETLLREAVALGYDDVLAHVLVAISKKSGDELLRRAVTRALAFAAGCPTAAPMVARLVALFPNSPSFRDEHGITALHFASTREIALMLQKAGASAAAVNDTGAYPIHTAAAAGNSEVVRCLLDSASIALRTQSGDTPLTIACFSGALPVVKLLANVGADLKMANANGMLPLHCAAVGNHAEVVRYLLSKGCQPNSVDGHGNTPMDLCAARGHLELIELFLEATKSALLIVCVCAYVPHLPGF